MSIKYNLFNITHPGTGEEECVAKAVYGTTVSSEQLEREIQVRSSLTTSDVKGCLDALSTLLKEHLKEGKSVHLKGIGYMKVSLQCTRKMTKDKPSGKYIKVRGVNFRPEKGMMNDLKDCNIELAKGSRTSTLLTKEELISRLDTHFKSNSYLRRSELERIAGINKEMACKWLRQLTADGILRKEGPRNSPIYLWNKKEGE